MTLLKARAAAGARPGMIRLPFFYGWLIVAITMVAGFLASVVSNITMAVVLKPISEDLGWSRTLTAAAVTLGACFGGLLSPLFGPMADRLGLFALLFGLNARGAGVLMQILIARYFGRGSFGAISSILDPFHKGGLGLGALFAGIAFDRAGSYQTVFAIFLASYLVAAVLIFSARRPRARL